MIKSEKYCDPFKSYLKGENGGAHYFWLSEDNVEKFLKAGIKALTFSIKSTQKLVLGSNIQSSIKFAFSLYFWTKLSKMFSGLTILLILDIFFFSFPVVYENNHKIIDAYVDQFNDVYGDVVDKINAFLPSGWRIRVKDEWYGENENEDSEENVIYDYRMVWKFVKVIISFYINWIYCKKFRCIYFMIMYLTLIWLRSFRISSIYE